MPPGRPARRHGVSLLAVGREWDRQAGWLRSQLLAAPGHTRSHALRV